MLNREVDVTIPEWEVPVHLRIEQLKNKMWKVAASLTTPSDHTYYPNELVEYEVVTALDLERPSLRLFQELRVSAESLPCLTCKKRCLAKFHEPRGDDPKANRDRAQRAIRSLLHCGLNHLLFEIYVDSGGLELLLFCEKETHCQQVNLLEELGKKDGLMWLYATMWTADDAERHRFAGALSRDLGAEVDYAIMQNSAFETHLERLLKAFNSDARNQVQRLGDASMALDGFCAALENSVPQGESLVEPLDQGVTAADVCAQILVLAGKAEGLHGRYCSELESLCNALQARRSSNLRADLETIEDRYRQRGVVPRVYLDTLRGLVDKLELGKDVPKQFQNGLDSLTRKLEVGWRDARALSVPLERVLRRLRDLAGRVADEPGWRETFHDDLDEIVRFLHAVPRSCLESLRSQKMKVSAARNAAAEINIMVHTRAVTPRAPLPPPLMDDLGRLAGALEDLAMAFKAEDHLPPLCRSGLEVSARRVRALSEMLREVPEDATPEMLCAAVRPALQLHGYEVPEKVLTSALSLFCRGKRLPMVLSEEYSAGRRTSATLFLELFLMALVLSSPQPKPGFEDPATREWTLSRARTVVRAAAVVTCARKNASNRVKRKVCHVCRPREVLVPEEDRPLVDELLRLVAPSGPYRKHSARLIKTLQRMAWSRECLLDKDDVPLPQWLRNQVEDRGLSRVETEQTIKLLCRAAGELDGRPCPLSAEPMSASVLEAAEQLEPELRDHRTRSAARLEACMSVCPAEAGCKVAQFANIQYSVLDSELLSVIRQFFILPEDLMFYFWRLAADTANTPHGSRFIGHCLEKLKASSMITGDQEEVFTLQLLSRAPDDYDAVVFLDVEQALPGFKEILSGPVRPGAAEPWTSLSRGECWKFLMMDDSGPKIPGNAMNSLPEVRLYSQYKKVTIQDAERNRRDSEKLHSALVVDLRFEDEDS